MPAKVSDPSTSIVILTGAGISAESGLPTFRGAGGLWEGHRVEEMATPGAFARDSSLVNRFYNQRRRQLRSGGIHPNEAHLAVARLQREWPGEVLLVTQNVDDLHERAGSHSLVHMHGELLRASCTGCGQTLDWFSDIDTTSVCRGCGRPGLLRPAIVWFGEVPLGLERIADGLRHCSIFVAIGTSGQVYPAAGFVSEVKAFGKAHTTEFNLEPTALHFEFDECIEGPCSETVPRWVDALLGRGEV